jgi:hypothetical protein
MPVLAKYHAAIATPTIFVPSTTLQMKSSFGTLAVRVSTSVTGVSVFSVKS